jgi:fumarate hydratase, class II
VFQTGSGTSTNMNANEVIAHLAARTGGAVHANDHVNMGQSSNDVIPTAIHVSAALLLREQLLPALQHLARCWEGAPRLAGVVKTGRTHLMDAMPVTLAQELSGWRAQIENAAARLRRCCRGCCGSRRAAPRSAPASTRDPDSARRLRGSWRADGSSFPRTDNYFEALSSQDTAVELSGQLKVLAVSLMKIANDLRWMNSGPLAGLGEIALPALQPGSSIMPGKVNPVVPEADRDGRRAGHRQRCDHHVAGQSGNFQLNVMLPVIAYNLLQSIELLANGSARWPITRSPASRSIERAPGGGAGAQSDPGDGAQSGHRLREGRGHRQEGLRRGPADPRGRRGNDRT